MNIPASNIMPANTVVQNGAEQNIVKVKNTLSARVAGVNNAPVVPASAGSPFAAITRFAGKVANATGLTRLATGLVNVGNAVGHFFGGDGNEFAITPLFTTGLKIAQYGVQKLFYEVMSLMKDQAWTIINTWLTKIIDDGGHMTPYEIFRSLITSIFDNPEIQKKWHSAGLVWPIL